MICAQAKPTATSLLRLSNSDAFGDHLYRIAGKRLMLPAVWAKKILVKTAMGNAGKSFSLWLRDSSLVTNPLNIKQVSWQVFPVHYLSCNCRNLDEVPHVQYIN